jgi:predicted  nucleic acid-binding Zn-ribbon protein
LAGLPFALLYRPFRAQQIASDFVTSQAVAAKEMIASEVLHIETEENKMKREMAEVKAQCAELMKDKNAQKRRDMWISRNMTQAERTTNDLMDKLSELEETIEGISKSISQLRSDVVVRKE